MSIKTLTYVILGKDELTPTFKKAGKEAESSTAGIAGSLGKVGFAGVALAGVIGGALVKSIKDARGEGWGPLKVAAKDAGVAFDAFKPKVEEAGKGMASLGFSQADTNKSLKFLLTSTQSAPKSLNALGTAADFARFKGIGLSDASQALAKAATGSTRALKDVGISTADLPKHFASTGTAASRMQIIMDLLQKRTGGAAKAFSEGFGGKLAVVKAQLENVSARIGAALLPILSSLLTMVSKNILPAIGKFGDWFGKVGAPAIKAFADKLTPIVSVLIGDFFKGLSSILGVLTKLPGPVKIAGLAIIALGVAMKLAANANPWILLGVAIITLVGLIINNWSKIERFTVAVWNRILGIIKGVWNWIKQNWPLIITIILGPLGIVVVQVIKHWNTILSTIKIILTQIKNAATTAWNAVGSAFKWAWDHILKPAISTLWTVFSTVFGLIINGAAKAFGWIPGIGGKLKDAAKKFNTFKDDVNRALGLVSNKTVNVSVAMTAATSGKGIAGKVARGGVIQGPGGPTDDRAGLFALSNDEYVVRASAHRKYGTRFMNTLNAGRLAAGGSAGLSFNVTRPSAQAIQSSINNRVQQLAKASFNQIFTAASAANIGGSGVQRWAPLVLQILAMFGQPLSLLNTVLRRMNQESGGNPMAINLWDTNAQHGDPSRGLMQTIMSTFLAHAGPYAGRGIYDPFANIYASFGYAISRYGSLSSAFNRAGGYAMGGAVSFDRGGFLAPHSATLALNGTGRYERVGGGGNTYFINVSPTPMARPADIGREVVGAIREFERGAGNGWRS